MPIRSVLLRLFLIVVLLFNGTATAVASVHMNHFGMAEGKAQVNSHKTSDTQAKMPCHDAETNEANGVVSHAGLHASSDTPEPTDAGTPSPDCCESGACRCVCLHHGQLATIAVASIAAAIVHTDSVRPMFSVHASPALPHLIRPPIG